MITKPENAPERERSLEEHLRRPTRFCKPSQSMRFKDLEINSSKLARPGCEHLDQKEKNTHTPKKRLKEGQHQPKQKSESDKKSGKALAVGLIVLLQVCEPLAAEHLLTSGDAGLASAKVRTITPVPPIRGAGGRWSGLACANKSYAQLHYLVLNSAASSAVFGQRCQSLE